MPSRRARSAARSPAARARAHADVLADRLHSAAIHLLRRLRRQDDTTGLSAPRLSALSVVVFAGPVTLGQLATAEQVRPPTMTRLVQALEREGLVTREPDPRDARVTRLTATAKGRALLATGRARRVAALASELDRLSTTDRAILRDAVDVLERMLGRGPMPWPGDAPARRG